MNHSRETETERDRERETETETERDSFRPLPLMKGCRWMTYQVTVHTIIMHINKKTNKLTTMCLNWVLKMTVCVL